MTQDHERQDHERLFPRALSQAEIDPAPRPAPQRRALAGRHVALEPLDPAAHGADLFRAGHDSEAARASWAYMPVGPWANAAEFNAFAQDIATRPDWVAFALRPANGPIEGMASYLNIVPAHGVVEIGAIWFSQRLKRTRAATEALFLLMAHAFDNLRYRRVEWKCNAANEASRAAARRLGFRFEGIFYRHMIVKGRNRDTAWYSLLDDEWPEARKRIGAWLEDGNFDEDGAQRQPLSGMSGNQGADVQVEAGLTAIEPISTPEFSLDDLIEGITRDNLHEDNCFDPPVGREAL